MIGKAKLLSAWERMRASYWFVPSLMAAGAAVLSFATLWVDTSAPGWTHYAPGLYTGTAEGARSLLSAIASSMIGLAGVVFSIVIVALTLASNQFGPRLLWNFMRDTCNQVVLGTFIAAFVYCILVMRQVHGGSESPQVAPFVPQLSILVAVALAVAGLGVLIFFIHHAAATIQAPNVIAGVATELNATIDRLFPDSVEGGKPDAADVDSTHALPADFEARSRPIPSSTAGYIQRIEAQELLDEASQHDLVIRVEHRPGQFLQSRDVIFHAWPAERVTDAVAGRLGQTFNLGNHRSPAQDAEFAIDQLVEVAVRALSPGTNDPFTAIQCLDFLGDSMSRLAERNMPSASRFDEQGRLRVVFYPHGFAKMLDAALNQIRQYAADAPSVLLRMLEVIERISRRLCDGRDVEPLRQHLAMVRDVADKSITGERDRQELHERLSTCSEAIEATARRLLPPPP